MCCDLSYPRAGRAPAACLQSPFMVWAALIRWTWRASHAERDLFLLGVGAWWQSGFWAVGWKPLVSLLPSVVVSTHLVAATVLTPPAYGNTLSLWLQTLVVCGFLFCSLHCSAYFCWGWFREIEKLWLPPLLSFCLWVTWEQMCCCRYFKTRNTRGEILLVFLCNGFVPFSPLNILDNRHHTVWKYNESHWLGFGKYQGSQEKMLFCLCL